MTIELNSVNQKLKINNGNILLNNKIYLLDVIEGLKKILSNLADIIIIDPPYNINKDFGNNKTNLNIKEYVEWSKQWIRESIRILKNDGTMFIYGFSEILAYIFVEIEIQKKWLVWHYTNKSIPKLNFWQRSHESIICAWKKQKIFNKDDIREPYSLGYSKISNNLIRANTKGRFSNGKKTTFYKKHEKGAQPRDVLKIPAFDGGAGAKERVNHPTQKPLKLSFKLIKSCLKKNQKNLIVVPFVGSGTECVAAKILKQDFIGFEINNEYLALAKVRLQKIE